MSRKGNCWDDAVVESFFSSLKKERIKKQICKNRALALADVTNYIDTFYNRTRRHGHPGGVSPEQYETAHRLQRLGSPLNPGKLHPAAPGHRGLYSGAALGGWPLPGM